MATPHIRLIDAEAKWSATRVPCGARSDNGHPCGRAARHFGACICRCAAERFLETRSAYVKAVAS